MDSLTDPTNQLLSLDGGEQHQYRTPTDPRYNYTLKDGFLPCYDKNTGETIRLSLSGETFIGICGRTGCGKTTGLKGFIGQAHQKNYNILNVVDPKADMQSINRKGGPSQELIDTMNGLPPSVHKQPVPRTILQPKVVADLYTKECSDCGARFTRTSRCPECSSNSYSGGTPSYVEKYTLGFQDVSREQFLSMLVDISSAAEQTMRNLLDTYSMAELTWQVLVEELEKKREEENRKQMIEPLLEAVKSLRNKDVLSNRLRKDPIDFLEQGDAVSISLENYEDLNYGSKFSEVLELYLRQLLEDFKDAVLRERRVTGSTLMTFLEAHEALPANSDSDLVQSVNRFMTRNARQTNTAMVFDTQEPRQLPHSETRGSADLVGKWNHAFLGTGRMGKPLSEDNWRAVLDSMGVIADARSELKEWRRLFRGTERFDFVYVTPQTRSASDARVVRFYCPPVNHPG